MLVLTRKVQEQIQIGDNITITILRMKGQAVRVGIDAPKEVRICRGELPRNTGLGTEAGELGEGVQPSSHRVPTGMAPSPQAPAASHGSTEPSRGQHRLPTVAGRLSSGSPRLPVRTGQRTTNPLLTIATRRLRRRRAQFIPEGRL